MASQSIIGKWTRRAILLCGSVVLAMAAAFLIAYFDARGLLLVEGGAKHADVIIVLGGDPGGRVIRALELYKTGAAPKILFTGRGDCYMNRDHLLRAGVSSNALIIEPRSRNTKENAEFSTEIMEARGMKTAIIVTSWFHSRRALACFEHFGGSMKFSSFPSHEGLDTTRNPASIDFARVFREYPAMISYAARYGIFSLETTPGAPTPGRP
jgi:uncharacterized SAM-binding protein YcdF (DUF218 family)